MASTAPNHNSGSIISGDLSGHPSGDSSDSDVPLVWNSRPGRVRQILDKKKTNSGTQSRKKEVPDKTQPPANANITTINYAREGARDNTQPPPGVKISATDLWDESEFKLQYPRLINPYPVKYIWEERPDPATDRFADKRTPSCFPVTPADDINKTIFVHPDLPRVKWGGGWGAAKLAKEIQKYERVKAFWLFENDHGYLPGFDDKHLFVAAVFAAELRSPWVVGWLRELIGEEDVSMISAAVEKIAGSDLGGSHR